MEQLYPHQQRAIEKLKNGSILWSKVGAGKSRAGIGYYLKKERDRDIYIITTAKKRDSLEWEKEAAAFGIGKEKNATVAGVLTVDSWNNLSKYIDVKSAFFIFDEQRLTGSGQWVKTFLKITKFNNWIMLSATPGDIWMDYIPVFIANGFYKNRSDFINQHVIYNRFTTFQKVDRYVGTSKLLRLRREILVEMPFSRDTVRHPKVLRVSYNEALIDRVSKERWNVFEDRPIRNMAELCLVIRKVVNQDVSRSLAIVDLMKKHEKLIVFYNFTYELELLKALSGTLWQEEPVPVAEWNGRRHQDIPNTNRWLYLVQYAAGAEGWNCIETDAMAFYSLTYSYKMFEQAHGRIDRINTKFTDLWYYRLISKAPIDQAIWRSLTNKKNFNERDFIQSKIKMV